MSIEHTVEYGIHLEKQWMASRQVLRGKQVECPFCQKATVEKTNETIHCPNGCFTRYISPELIALDVRRSDLFFKGATERIHAIFKDGHIQFIDYIENYKDGILTIRIDYNRRYNTPIYGEPIEINIQDLSSIEIPIKIK